MVYDLPVFGFFISSVNLLMGAVFVFCLFFDNRRDDVGVVPFGDCIG